MKAIGCLKLHYNHEICSTGKFRSSPEARKHFNTYQTQILMEKFQACPYLQYEEAVQLAKSLNISVDRIRMWFQNRRQKESKEGSMFEGEFLNIHCNV